MSTIKKIIYKCDVCGKEFGNKSSIQSIFTPIKYFDCEGKSSRNIMKEIDMCESCKEKYFEVIFKYFAETRDINGVLSSNIKFN